MNARLERQVRRAYLALLWAMRGARPLIPPPRMAQIEITNRCNITCRTCTRLRLPHLGDLSLEDFRGIIDRIGRVERLWLSGQGEPLMHRDLARMIRYARDAGIRGTIVHTNAMLLDGAVADAIAGSGLGELKVSIDGGSAEDLEYLRSGASMQRILANVARFTSMDSGVRVSFYSVLNRRNAGSAHLLPALAAGVGVRHVTFVETVPFRDESTEREIYDRREYQFASLPVEARRAVLAAIRRAATESRIELTLELKWFRKRCFDPFLKMYVDHQGNVTPCCRIHNEVFVGNILRDGLDGSWYGKAMTRWRTDLLSTRSHRRICVERCNLGIGAERRIDV